MKKILLLNLVLGMLGFISACGSSEPGPQAGQSLAASTGCSACHSVDDRTKIAPPWRGLYGSQVELDDGNIITVDEAYLIESIKEPNAKIVKGFTRGAMPKFSLTEDDINSLVAYIKSVK